MLTLALRTDVQLSPLCLKQVLTLALHTDVLLSLFCV